jgi:hypothetical protein
MQTNEVEAPMMASGKNAKKSRSAPPVVSRSQGLPWLTIGAVVLVLALVGGIFTVVYSKHKANSDAAAAVAPFVPSATNKDPSTKIAGIYAGVSTVASNGTLSFTEYKAALHVSSTQRVAYDRYPPVGGPHDAEWAACNGDVYTTAVRNENMVHPLEHGAIWITYNPATIAAGDLDKLKALVTNKTYIYMSPYPNLDSPISLQAWAHQLKVTSASDIRIKQFITALQQNQFIAPEPGGNCDQPGFAASPPAFVATKPGADAVQMNGAGLTADTTEGIVNAGATGASGAATSGSGASATSAATAKSGAATSTASTPTTAASSK